MTKRNAQLQTPQVLAQSNCSPAYPDVCIPDAPPDLNFKDIHYRNFRVLHQTRMDLIRIVTASDVKVSADELSREANLSSGLLKILKGNTWENA